MPTLLKIKEQWYKVKAEDVFLNEQLNVDFLDHINEVADMVINTEPFDLLSWDEYYTEELFNAERVVMFANGLDGINSLPYYEKETLSDET